MIIHHRVAETQRGTKAKQQAGLEPRGMNCFVFLGVLITARDTKVHEEDARKEENAIPFFSVTLW